MNNTAIIIASWNGRKYLKECLYSLAAQTNKKFKVIFVDNGSEDGSVGFVEKNYPEIKIVKFKKNTGFCFGYNAGIEKALEDKNTKYVVVLNNDTKLDENYVKELINCAQGHPDAGSIQPKVINFFEKDKIDCAGIEIAPDGTAHNRGYKEDEVKYDEEKEIFGANGTASLFTRIALEKTKFRDGEYFDNDHFAFYEDVDLAWRIKLAGLKSYYCPRSIIQHVHGGTAGRASLLKAYYLHRNYFFTVFKNYPAGIMAGTLVRRFASYVRLVFNVFKKEQREAEFTRGYGKGKVALIILKAWGSALVSLPNIIKKRNGIRKKRIVRIRDIREWMVKYEHQ